MEFKYRWSPTLGSFEESPSKVWGIEEISGDTGTGPVVFCGLYSLKDFMALWSHKGKRYVWFTGSDIPRLQNGYWLSEDGELSIPPYTMWKWINENCECWCENKVEATALSKMGIVANYCPSFLGDPSNFPVTYEWSERPKVYASVSGDDFKLYGWDVIFRIANRCPGVEFHLYGNTRDPELNGARFDLYKGVTQYPRNIKVHGRVPKEQMNAEIASMQAGLRPVEFDGCSEIIVKSVLQGQWTISRIPYPFTQSYKNDDELVACINGLVNKKEPNLEGREWLLKNLNAYPWVLKHK